MSTGKIVQVIGAVVDIEFPEDAVPKINDALVAEQGGTVFEVQQQLGDGVVRTITMGSSEGLVRGMDVKNTGKPITVPGSRYNRYSVNGTSGAPAPPAATSRTRKSATITQPVLSAITAASPICSVLLIFLPK